MNYGQLKQAVREYAHRDIQDGQMLVFLALAEQRIYYGESNTPALRIAALKTKAALADGTRPADFLEAVTVNHDGDALLYKPLPIISNATRAFVWDGAQLVLSPDVEFPVDLTYYRRLPTPSVDADTNWIMDNAPGVYLSAMLIEFARWAVDNEMLMRETSAYTSAVQTLMSQDRAAAISGSVLIGSPA